jgi:hypothetical protein
VRVLKFLVSLVTFNLPVKLIALFLAGVVWFGLDAQITDRTRQEVPVDVVLLNKKNWQVVDRDAEKVTITVKGVRSDISRIRDLVIRDVLRGVIRLDEKEIKDSGQSEEVHTKDIKPETFNLHFRDLTFEAIEPGSIKVHLVRMERREVRIKPKLLGTLEKGYRVVSARVTPSKLTVRAPRKVLEDATEIETEPVFLYGWNSTFKQENVRVVREFRGYPLEADQRVTVHVTVDRETGERTVERVTVHVSFPRRLSRDRYRIEVDEWRNVKVRGPVDLIEKITPNDLRLVAELDIADFQKWMDPKSESQEAKARLHCFVVGPTREIQRVVEPVLASGELHYKIFRLKKE